MPAASGPSGDLADDPPPRAQKAKTGGWSMDAGDSGPTESSSVRHPDWGAHYSQPICAWATAPAASRCRCRLIPMQRAVLEDPSTDGELRARHAPDLMHRGRPSDRPQAFAELTSRGIECSLLAVCPVWRCAHHQRCVDLLSLKMPTGSQKRRGRKHSEAQATRQQGQRRHARHPRPRGGARGGYHTPGKNLC